MSADWISGVRSMRPRYHAGRSAYDPRRATVPERDLRGRRRRRGPHRDLARSVVAARAARRGARRRCWPACSSASTPGHRTFTVALHRRADAAGAARRRCASSGARPAGQEGPDRRRDRCTPATSRSRARTALRLRLLDRPAPNRRGRRPTLTPLPPPGDASQFRFPRMESGELGFWNAVEMSRGRWGSSRARAGRGVVAAPGAGGGG